MSSVSGDIADAVLETMPHAQDLILPGRDRREFAGLFLDPFW
jgi:hypothetical protein